MCSNMHRHRVHGIVHGHMGIAGGSKLQGLKSFLFHDEHDLHSTVIQGNIEHCCRKQIAG